jgi:hypothetical protein
MARGGRHAFRTGRSIRGFTLIAAVTAVAGLMLGQASAALASTGLKKIHDPGKVTYSIHIANCKFRDGGKLPDSKCTPGSIDPAVTQNNINSTICKSGWTAKVRPPESQTEHAKYDVAYPAYHVKQSATSELDHLVPLELGGSNDITNLWPEIGKPTGNPKDSVENALNHAVCAGKVSLAAAQQDIAANWTTAVTKLGLKAWCTAKADWNSTYDDYDVYVNSNEPDKEAVATASDGVSHGYKTNGSGYADIYLDAGRGDTIKVTVGPASCSTKGN